MVDLTEVAKWVAIVFIMGVIAQIAKSLTKGALGNFLEELLHGKVSPSAKDKPAERKPSSNAEIELEKERIKSQEKLEKKRLKMEKKKVKEEAKRQEKEAERLEDLQEDLFDD